MSAMDPEQNLELAMINKDVATRRTIQPRRDSPIQLLIQDQDSSFLSSPSFSLSSLTEKTVTNAPDRLREQSEVTSRLVTDPS